MTTRPSLIEQRLGPEHAQRLARLVGGTRLSVPADPKNGAHLSRLIGADLALLVMFHFGGSRFYVPTLTRVEQVDCRKVRRLAAKGWSSARIARKLGCSERIVDRKRAIRAETPPPASDCDPRARCDAGYRN